jgi:hypothetical protein
VYRGRVEGGGRERLINKRKLKEAKLNFMKVFLLYIERRREYKINFKCQSYIVYYKTPILATGQILL